VVDALGRQSRATDPTELELGGAGSCWSGYPENDSQGKGIAALLSPISVTFNCLRRNISDGFAPRCSRNRLKERQFLASASF